MARNPHRQADKARLEWLHRDVPARPIKADEIARHTIANVFRGKEGRYIASHIRRGWDDVINVKGGWKKGDGPHLIRCEIGEFAPDPHNGEIMSVLPRGAKPVTILLKVTPKAGSRNTAADIAQIYQNVFGYAFWEVVDVVNNTTVTIVLHLHGRLPLRDLHPDDLEHRFQELMAELHAGDKEGRFPVMIPGTLDYERPDHLSGPLGPMVAEPILKWRPPVLAFHMMPTPLQLDPKEHQRIIEATANRLGYRGIETDPFDPVTGIGITLWRDGTPALFPIPHTDLGGVWDRVGTELWGQVKGMTPPKQLSPPKWGPTIPERPTVNGLGEADSIIVRPRPVWGELQLGVDEVNFEPTVKATLRQRLGYHRLSATHRANEGLVIRFDRDPLPKGELIPLDELPTTGPFLLGRTYDRTGILWDFIRDPMAKIAGIPGAGKGDLQMIFAANALIRDWLVFFINPKGTAESNKLKRAMIDVQGLDQTTALLMLAELEVDLRNWKMQHAADGLYHPDAEITSIRDRFAYDRLSDSLVAEGKPALPPLGPEFLFIFDESRRHLNKQDDGGYDEPTVKLRKALRAANDGFVARARSSGGHGVYSTQDPRVDSYGGGAVTGQLTFTALLRVVKAYSFQILPDLEKWEREALMYGGGQGQMFFSGPDGACEGQAFWADDNPDWIADALVGPYLERNPRHEALGRDWVVEYAVARKIFGATTAKPDFSKVDHKRFPYALGRQALISIVADELIDLSLADLDGGL